MITKQQVRANKTKIVDKQHKFGIVVDATRLITE